MTVIQLALITIIGGVLLVGSAVGNLDRFEKLRKTALIIGLGCYTGGLLYFLKAVGLSENVSGVLFLLGFFALVGGTVWISTLTYKKRKRLSSSHTIKEDKAGSKSYY